ncbi:amidase [Cutibacterium equinum]|uniref:Amidase n=1 Tax=Cutibacterium equinum TaxID=3016342 RepID=A0ABY7QZK8_9ACTN|nr:amidase [Cutibacterium equinum]WCC79697.1 amidase [Cutibacterium equinum]
MTMEPITALETSTRIAAGELGVLEVVDAALEAAHADQCHAWTWIDDDGARNTARELQRQLDTEQVRPGPLFGVPCPIKDLDSLDGAPRHVGSRAVGGSVADHDDGIVTRLKSAGAIPIGTTAAPEFGLPCYTEPDGRDATVTPWDHTRMAGGSSGGAAAAVGAGEVPIAQGSDGGGSIRIPASCCGVVGLKPSRGRVSFGPYGIDGPGLVSGGVLTRTVRDTAAALDVLCEPWPGDPYFAPSPTESFLSVCDRGPGRLRIGILREPVITDTQVHPDIMTALDQTAGVLESMGHIVEPTTAPFGRAEWESFQCVWEVGAAAISVPPEREEFCTPLSRWLRDRGRRRTGIELAEALAGIQMVARRVAQHWQQFDAIVSPTLAQPPLPVGALRNDDDPAADFDAQCRFTPWTSLWNITGRPAMSVPLHTAMIDGVELPIGIMIGGRMYDEATVLQLGCALERAQGGSTC